MLVMIDRLNALESPPSDLVGSVHLHRVRVMALAAKTKLIHPFV